MNRLPPRVLKTAMPIFNGKNTFPFFNHLTKHSLYPSFKPSIETQVNRAWYSTQPFDFESSLNTIAQQLAPTDNPFENVMVVAVQHALGTTVDMFKLMHNLGLKKAIIAGKSYSTHPPCAEELRKLGYQFIDAPYQLGYGRFDGCMQETTANLWFAALQEMERSYQQGAKIDLLIILDDGGDLILSTPGKLFNGIPYKPNRIIGIEQTRGGSNHRCFKGVPYPIIDVAGSYVKTSIEYPYVAEIIANKVINRVQKETQQWHKEPIIGVIGNGVMGQAIVRQLLAKDYYVLIHDKANKVKPQNVIWYNELPSLISSADVIIGCTGTDITAAPNNLEAILNSIKPKYLVSSSSKDIEFNTLLTHIQAQKKQLEQTPNPLADICYQNLDNPAKADIILLRGGFPINFDNQEHCVPPEKIWPTRAALMAACLKAIKAHKENVLTSADVFKLDPNIQLSIIKEFQRFSPQEEHNPVFRMLAQLGDEKMKQHILSHSDGVALSGLSTSLRVPTPSL